jgi:uroporphyrinogen decarboxylase
MAALKLEEPDRVPYFDYFDIESVIKLGRLFQYDAPELKYGIDYSLDEVYKLYELQFALMKELDLGAMYQGFSSGEERIADSDDLYMDRYGVVFQMSPHGESFAVDGPVRDASDLKKLTRMEPRDSDFKLLEYCRETEPDIVYFLGMGDPFKWSWRLLGGMEKLLMLYIDNPDLCLDLARISTDFLFKIMDMAVAKSAEGILMDGDLADNRTTYMSPDHFRKFLKPFYREIVDHAHKLGVPILKHTDGNMWPILDDMVECGFEGFHPFEPGPMDIVEAKEHLKGKACVLGNIDCGQLLPFGTEEEVEEAVKDTIQKVAPGGGYILTSSNSIHPGCKPENVVAMFRAAKKYGAYPIQL